MNVVFVSTINCFVFFFLFLLSPFALPIDIAFCPCVFIRVLSVRAIALAFLWKKLIKFGRLRSGVSIKLWWIYSWRINWMPSVKKWRKMKKKKNLKSQSYQSVFENDFMHAVQSAAKELVQSNNEILLSTTALTKLLLFFFCYKKKIMKSWWWWRCWWRVLKLVDEQQTTFLVFLSISGVRAFFLFFIFSLLCVGVLCGTCISRICVTGKRTSENIKCKMCMYVYIVYHSSIHHKYINFIRWQQKMPAIWPNEYNGINFIFSSRLKKREKNYEMETYEWECTMCDFILTCFFLHAYNTHTHIVDDV